MFNIDYLSPLETSRKHIFGFRNFRDPTFNTARYSPPSKIRILECHGDINGELL